MPSKAAALRFFAAHIGRVFETSQTGPTGAEVWNPGPRTLARRNASSFTLDGSIVHVLGNHVVTALNDTSLTVEWRHADESLIHTTTYTLAANKPDTASSPTPAGRRMTTAERPGTPNSPEVEQAAARYRQACVEYAAATDRLTALTDAAEKDPDIYAEADDYRNYGYASTVGDTLDAAQRLLSLLGHPARPEAAASPATPEEVR